MRGRLGGAFFILILLCVSTYAFTLFGDDREEKVKAVLSDTAKSVGWPQRVFEYGQVPGKAYGISVAGGDADVDKAFIGYGDANNAKQFLDTLQENGMRRTTFHGYDAVIMRKGEKVCEAGGTVGIVLDWVRKGIVWLGQQLGTTVDPSQICAEATGTVSWRCNDVYFAVNSPDEDDNSAAVAEVLFTLSEKAKLCDEGENLTGKVYDDKGVALHNVKITLKYDGTEKTTYARDDGTYEIKGPATFIPDPENEKIGELTVELVDKDGKIEVRDGSDGDKIVFIRKKFELKSKGDLKQDVKFPLTDFSDMATSTNRDHLHDAAVIYHETLTAIKFYPKYLKENVDFQPPETIHVYHPKCTACHSGLPGGNDEGIFYNPAGSVYNNVDRHDNREWHEFAHHMMVDTYGAFPVTTGQNHGIFNNPDTADSWLEGFACVMPLIMANEYGQAKPEVYDWNGGASNLEANYKDTEDEEFCIAGVVWDLYDGKDAKDEDNVQLTKEQLWKIIGTKTDNLKHLYDKLNASGIKDLTEDEDKDGITDLDQIYISHGIYQDANNNTKYDKNETVGKGDINRPGRE